MEKSVESLAEEQKTCEAAQSRNIEVEEDFLTIVTKRDALKTYREKGAPGGHLSRKYRERRTMVGD